MVTFLSLIIAANVPVVGLKSRPIWISPGFDLKTSSMVNSADMDSLVGISHLLWERLKQSAHLKKPLLSIVCFEKAGVVFTFVKVPSDVNITRFSPKRDVNGKGLLYFFQVSFEKHLLLGNGSQPLAISFGTIVWNISSRFWSSISGLEQSNPPPCSNEISKVAQCLSEPEESDLKEERTMNRKVFNSAASAVVRLVPADWRLGFGLCKAK